MLFELDRGLIAEGRCRYCLLYEPIQTANARFGSTGLFHFLSQSHSSFTVCMRRSVSVSPLVDFSELLPAFVRNRISFERLDSLVICG